MKKTSKSPWRCLFASTLLFMAACSASGPSFEEIESLIPPIASGKGRIYFFRTYSFAGAAVQPGIHLNGKEVGSSEPGGFFFVDEDPGSQEVSCSTETENKLTFTLEPQDTRYVETSVSIGFFVGHVTPRLVDPEVGEKGIRDCSYTGPELGVPVEADSRIQQE